MSQPASATATFLFTDIEGSTALLKQLREGYGEVLAEHHRMLREAFAAHGGTEIDNQGDAFFVAFRRARDAVLAAAQAQRALAEHRWPEDAPVRVRMGIHTGEAELEDERYVGVSVHRAARISALGHGGQVLVSQTTEHLLEEERLPGLTLRDLGEQRLKDLERPIRVYQLDIDGLRNSFPQLKASAPPPSSHRWAFVAGAAAFLAVAAAATTFIVTRGESPPEVVPNSVVRIDPDSGKPTQVIPVGKSPDLIVAAGGYVWTTHYVLRDTEGAGLRNAGDRTLTRVDPHSGEAVVVGGGLAPCGLTADPSGDVWVANCFGGSAGARTDNIVRVDAETLRFERTFAVPATTESIYRGLAYGGGSLWVSGVERSGIYELDPSTGTRRTFSLDRMSDAALAWADGYGDLWWASFVAGGLSRLRPATGAMTYSKAPDGTYPAPVVVAGDAVWAGDWNSPTVLRVNAVRSRGVRLIDLAGAGRGSGVWSVTASDRDVWAATPRARSIWKIDPQTNAVERIRMAYPPGGVAATGNDVWVAVRE